MVERTSIDAYRLAKEQRKTQEGTLLALLRQYPEGLTDSQIAERMGLAKSQASARRNGIKDKLASGGGLEALAKVGTITDPKTKKTVNLWAIVRRSEGQTKLF